MIDYAVTSIIEIQKCLKKLGKLCSFYKSTLNLDLMQCCIFNLSTEVHCHTSFTM